MYYTPFGGTFSLSNRYYKGGGNSTKLIEQDVIQKVLNGEHWKDNLSGLKWTDQLKDMALAKHAHEIKLWRSEDQLKRLAKLKTIDEIINAQKNAYTNMIESTCVAALKPHNSSIKEIGFNVPDDLFTNNWGVLLASCIHGDQGHSGGLASYDETNTQRITTVGSYQPRLDGQGQWHQKIQFGSGTTAAARNNYTVQTAFATSPESGKFQCGLGAYASGVISFGNLITAGGSGTINEICLYHNTYWYTSGITSAMITHDILGAGVAFVAGNPLVGTFAINI